MIIDAHNHFLPDTLVDYFRHHGEKFNTSIVSIDGKEYLKQANFMSPNFKEHYDYDLKVADLNKMGIDKAILSVSPMVFFYWADKNDTLDTSRICNDWVSDLCQKHPDRFMGMATIPMQDTSMALKELERAHTKLGLNALEISSAILDYNNLDEERFFPIYEYCNSNNILLYLHPLFVEIPPELKKYYNANLIGNVYQTNVGLNHLIFGGVFEKYPKLNVLASHAGGYFPYQLGRLMHGYKVRKEPKVNIQKSPENYLGNIYFDTLTHWVPALQFLVDNFGADHVVIGTDYPYDMGDYEPLNKVNSLKIDNAQRQQILGGNIQRIMEL